MIFSIFISEKKFSMLYEHIFIKKSFTLQWQKVSCMTKKLAKMTDKSDRNYRQYTVLKANYKDANYTVL